VIFVDDVSAYSGFDTFVCVIRNACKNLYLSSKLSLETPPNLEFNYGKVGGLNQMFTLRNQNVLYAVLFSQPSELTKFLSIYWEKTC